MNFDFIYFAVSYCCWYSWTD